MLDFLAEQKIAEAVSRGELDHLPGQGRPLALDDDPLMPEDLRVAYRILKNGGSVPAEVETLNETARAKALKKLALLRTRIENRYCEQALRKLSA